jgi:ATP-binding cassette subfamily F protein 3
MIKSRQKKLEDRWGLEQSAKGTRFKLNRDRAGFHFTQREAIEIEHEDVAIRIRLTDPPELKGNLICFENIGFGYGTKRVLREVNLVMTMGEKVVIVGANGKGKSTLAKLLAGELEPQAGSVYRHSKLRIGYYDQVSLMNYLADVKHSIDTLAGEYIPALRYFLDHFSNNSNQLKTSDARAYLGSFGLGGALADQTSIQSLSGGQKVSSGEIRVVITRSIGSFSARHALLLPTTAFVSGTIMHCR